MEGQAQIEGARIAEDDGQESFLTVHGFLDILSYGALPEGDTIVVFRRARGGSEAN